MIERNDYINNNNNNNNNQLTNYDDSDIPNEFICPITQEIMCDPVVAADGFTYEREAIQKWLDTGRKLSPKTGLKMPNSDLRANINLKILINDFKNQNPTVRQNKLTETDLEIAIKLREEDIANLIDKKDAQLKVEREARVKLLSEIQKMSENNQYTISGIANKLTENIFENAKKKFVPTKEPSNVLVRKYHSWFENEEYETYLKSKISTILCDYLESNELIDESTNKLIIEELKQKIIPSIVDIFYQDFWERNIGTFWQKTGCIRVYEEKINRDHIFKKLDEALNIKQVKSRSYDFSKPI